MCLLDSVDTLGLRESTLVIYLGDNGMQWGTHDCHGIREPHEDALKLPFIVRTQRYKYVEFERGRSPWLFDLATDPKERVNLFSEPDARTILKEMQSHLKSWTQS